MIAIPMMLKRSILALAVVAAAVCAVGIGTTAADAQTPSIDTHGPYTGDVGSPFAFVATTNVGPVASARWSFSDGTVGEGLAVNKLFRTPGIYTATVTVTSTAGQTFQASTTAHVSAIYPYPGLLGAVLPHQLGTAVVGTPIVGGFVSTSPFATHPVGGFVSVTGSSVTPVVGGVVATATPFVVNQPFVINAGRCTGARVIVNGVLYC